jgi:hypothetical protein
MAELHRIQSLVGALSNAALCRNIKDVDRLIRFR